MLIVYWLQYIIHCIFSYISHGVGTNPAHSKFLGQLSVSQYDSLLMAYVLTFLGYLPVCRLYNNWIISAPNHFVTNHSIDWRCFQTCPTVWWAPYLGGNAWALTDGRYRLAMILWTQIDIWTISNIWNFFRITVGWWKVLQTMGQYFLLWDL